jgi:hypothetical protein
VWDQGEGGFPSTQDSIGSHDTTHHTTTKKQQEIHTTRITPRRTLALQKVAANQLKHTKTNKPSYNTAGIAARREQPWANGTHSYDQNKQKNID